MAVATASDAAMPTRVPRRASGPRRRPPANSALENAANHDVQVLPITAPKGGIHPEHDAVIGVEAESDPIILLEILEVQISTLVGDLPGIVEEGAVEGAPNLPAV